MCDVVEMLTQARLEFPRQTGFVEVDQQPKHNLPGPRRNDAGLCFIRREPGLPHCGINVTDERPDTRPIEPTVGCTNGQIVGVARVDQPPDSRRFVASSYRNRTQRSSPTLDWWALPEGDVPSEKIGKLVSQRKHQRSTANACEVGTGWEFPVACKYGSFQTQLAADIRNCETRGIPQSQR
jgi:hypothetical protein